MTSVGVGQIAVESDGEGAPIVLVHGLGGSSNSFQALLGALRGFRCVRPDLPGSARSRLPDGALSIDVLTRSIAEVASALAARPAHFVGHSLGSLVCQHLAALMPDAALSLTLFGPILAPSEVARQRLRDRARLARREGMAAVVDAIVATGLSSSTRNDHPIAVSFVRESHMRQDAEAFAQSCEALAEAHAADLRLVAAPVLLVTGDEDAVAPPGVAQAIADRIQHARVQVLHRCGHWTPIERPAECGRLLSEFVRAHRR